MRNMQYDYPPEWDEDEASLQEKNDDFDPPDDDYDDPKESYERMTDAEIRYNRGY